MKLFSKFFKDALQESFIDQANQHSAEAKRLDELIQQLEPASQAGDQVDLNKAFKIAFDVDHKYELLRRSGSSDYVQLHCSNDLSKLMLMINKEWTVDFSQNELRFINVVLGEGIYVIKEIRNPFVTHDSVPGGRRQPILTTTGDFREVLEQAIIDKFGKQD